MPIVATAQASNLVVCLDAGHAFHADYRLRYHKADAAEGLQRAPDWFKAKDVV
jgi:dienelactone hydrolase